MFGLDGIYFHGIIRKYVIFFGSLFADIWIQRNKAGIQQTFKIPINYGNKEKFLARLQGNSDLDRQVAITLPRMSFEITNMMYDQSRKLLNSNRIPIQTPDGIKYQNNPVPYNIGFRLSIMTKSVEDGTMIVEQILPAFTPELTATLNLIPETNTKLDVPLILNDVSQTDTYEGSFEVRRAVIWELDFTMKAWMMGPIQDGGGIIKHAEINFAIPSLGIDFTEVNPGNSSDGSSIEVYPGLTEANTPVSWEGAKDAPNHPTNYVDPFTVEKEDNWGFIVDFSGED